MANRELAIIGATGDVGAGVVRSSVARGWHVVAVARNEARLRSLSDEHGSLIRTVVGSVADDEAGARLADALGDVDAMVISVNVACPIRPILEWPVTELNQLVAGNVGAHLVAARHLLPRVRPGGDYLGLGGGMADLVLPRYVPLAIAQAAQRQLYRGLVREQRRTGRVRVRELLIRAMVNGESTRDRAKPDWITENEIGDHVIELLDEPASDSDVDSPILELVSPRAVHLVRANTS